MKCIILAGGSSMRLYPITKGVSKQLVPINDKTMVYYPLSVLMLAVIKEVLIITTLEDQTSFMRFEYMVQPSPDGLAQVFILSEEFLGEDNDCLVLAGNMYYGHNLSKMPANAGCKTVSNNPR